MNEALNNKIWHFLFDNVGVHPDEVDIDWTSPESVEASLVAEGYGEWTVPRDTTPTTTFARFCMEAANHSMLVDKTFAYSCAKKSPKLKAFWKECTPSDSVEVADALLENAQKQCFFVVK